MEERPIHLLVQPLEEMVAHKMFFALSRSKCIDFIDIWMAFNKYPSIISKVRESIHCGPRDIEGFTYPACDLEKLVANFAACEAGWEDNVRDYQINVGSYASVGHALKTWLPELARRAHGKPLPTSRSGRSEIAISG